MVKQTTTIEPKEENYYEILPMTFEERVKLYMKCSKLDLARMLAERDKIDETRQPQVVPCPIVPYTPPNTPYPDIPYPYYPWNQPWYTTTTTTADKK